MPSYSKNKKAYHDFDILETIEAGLVLYGDEVKSIKNSQANLKGAYIIVEESQAFTNKIHISPYKFSSSKVSEPFRQIKLILHKKEILKIEKAITEKGITCIPLELYSKQGLIKIQIGICKGKKLYDKRADLKKKDQNIDIQRAIKNY